MCKICPSSSQLHDAVTTESHLTAHFDQGVFTGFAKHSQRSFCLKCWALRVLEDEITLATSATSGLQTSSTNGMDTQYSPAPACIFVFPTSWGPDSRAKYIIASPWNLHDCSLRSARNYRHRSLLLEKVHCTEAAIQFAALQGLAYRNSCRRTIFVEKPVLASIFI